MHERTEEEKELFAMAQNIAKKILSNEIDSQEAVENIRKIHFQLGYPDELEIWSLLYDGHSSDWYDRSRWIPFMSTYNHEKWLETVKLEAINLANANFS